MNRSELVDAIHQQTGIAHADVVRIVNSLIAQVEAAVWRGERVTLTGFGTFERRQRDGHHARNPRTGETVWVEPTLVPVFRPGQGFKDVCSGKVAAPRLTQTGLRLLRPPTPRRGRRQP